MKTAFPALGILVLAAASPLRAEESGGTRASASHTGSASVRVSGDTGITFLDFFVNSVALGLHIAAVESAVPPPAGAPMPSA